jgi:hypothetical protein
MVNLYFWSLYPIKNIDERHRNHWLSRLSARRGTWDVRQERWDPRRRLDLKKKDVEGSMDRSRFFWAHSFPVYIYIDGVYRGIYINKTYIYLACGFNHIEKYESQWEGLPHILWKIKCMFQTTNQYISIYCNVNDTSFVISI